MSLVQSFIVEEEKPVVGGDGKPVVGGDGKPVVGGDGKPVVGGDGKPVVGGDGKPVVGGSKEKPKSKIPPIPFTNQQDGDAFREWVHKNHPEYIKKVPGFKRSYKEFNNKAIQSAWNLFYKEYTASAPTTNQTQTQTPTQTQTQTQTQTVDNSCLTWKDNPFEENYYRREWGKKAIEFMDWFIDRYSKLYQNMKNNYDKKRQCRVDNLDHYLESPSPQRHDFIKVVANSLNSNKKTYFDEWFEDVEGNDPRYSSRFDEKSKDESKWDNNDKINAVKKSAESYQISSQFQKFLKDSETIANKKDDDLDRGECKDFLNDYLKQSQSVMDKSYLGSDVYNQKLENAQSKKAAQKCDTKFSYLFNKTTKILKSGVTDKNFQLHSENIMKNTKTLSESINEKIFDYSIKKQMKSELYKKQYSYISENIDKKNYKKAFDYIFENKKFGILSEETEDFDKAFKSLFYKNESKVKEESVNYILSKLNVTGPIKDSIKSELMSIPDSEVDRMLTTPSFLSDKIMQGINKAVVFSNDEEGLNGILKSVMVQSLRTNMDEIKFRIATSLKDILEQVKQNTINTHKNLKSKVVGGLEAI
jgi:hypothetical protein